MDTNVIKQIVHDGQYGTQVIKMIVRSNERGPKGEQGDSGVAATITAGNAYSVPATAEPAVINSGTSENAIFDFYIPRTTAAWGDITGNIENQADLKEYLDEANTAVQPDDIDYTVMQDLSVNSNASTSVLQLDADKVNLKSGDTSTKNIPLPVASSTQAGVMNSASYDTLVANSASIEAILNGMVAVAGLPSAPTQAELTAAWKTTTGLTELLNFAKMLDIDNNKYWTYYTNTDTWYSGNADIQVSVNTFTNSSEGTILGSTNVGQIYAEGNGTGSVNGWDALSASVANNTANKLASANLKTDTTISKTITGTGQSTEITLGLADGAVNASKIENNSITAAKLDYSTLTKSFPVSTTTCNIGYSFEVNIVRIANMVFVNKNTNVGNFNGTKSRYKLNTRTFPIGYRPTTSGVIGGFNQDYAANDVRACWEIGSDGSIRVSAGGGADGQCRLALNGCWTTSDEWPS